MDDLASDFMIEAAHSLSGLQAGLAALSLGDAPDGTVADMLRRMHALKGLCGLVGLARAEAMTHSAETLLTAIESSGRPPSWRAMALIADTLQRLCDLFMAAGSTLAEPEGGDHDLVTGLELAAIAQETEFSDAGAPGPERRARAPWAGLDTLVRGLGDRLGKRIDLMIGGEDVRVALEASAPLRTALIALVRNACDHGVERPEERRAAGKPGRARLQLFIRRTDDGFAIDLSDDGRGVDAERVRSRVEALGLAPPDALAAMDAQALQHLVFASGVSTAAEVTSISGRGVGLDLVRREIEGLGGSVDMSSVPGHGVRFTLNLPASALARPTSRRLAAA